MPTITLVNFAVTDHCCVQASPPLFRFAETTSYIRRPLQENWIRPTRPSMKTMYATYLFRAMILELDSIGCFELKYIGRLPKKLFAD
jgi:hypothetical protein